MCLNEVGTGLHEQRITGFQFDVADFSRKSSAVSVNRHDRRVVVRAELGFPHGLTNER